MSGALELIGKVQRLRRLRETLTAKRGPSHSSTKLAAFAARYRNDYLEFCKLLEIVDRSGKRISFTLKPTQLAYVAARTPRDYVLKGRRVGMTTEALARDLHHFLTHDGASVLVVCQSSQENSGINDVLRILEPMLAAIERVVEIPFATRTRTEWKLANGNHLRVTGAGASALAANKKGRAGAVTRLHATEVAFWEYAGATLIALLQCVPGPQFGTEIQFESTPNGAAGEALADKSTASGASWFHWGCQDAAAGKSGYAFHFFEWWTESEHALPIAEGDDLAPRTERERSYAGRLTPEQFKFYRDKAQELGPDKADQEYPPDPVTCFLVSGRGFFDKATVATLAASCIPPIEIAERGALRIWKQVKPGASYVLSADPSEGVDDGDPSAALVYERGTGEHVATIHGLFIPYDFAALLARVGRKFNTATIAVERNNHGHAVLQALERECRYPRIYRHHDGKLGWLTNEASRAPMLDAMDASMRKGAWKSCDAAVVGEARVFIISKTGKPEAQRGAHDDLVMAGAIGWAVLGKPVVHRSIPSHIVA